MSPRPPCLGERVSGLADGSLTDDVRDRALVHVAGCPTCHQALDVERRLVERVRALPTPAPSDALLARLVALGETGGPLPPRPGRVAGTPRQPTVMLVGLTPGSRPTFRAAGSTRPGGRREQPRSRRALVVAAGALGLGAIAVTALGSSLPSSGPAVAPPVSQLTVQHGVTGANNPFSQAGLVRLLTPGPTAVPVLRQVER